jgi:glycosyltransferase involved in cell wall biosynthesis
VVNNASTDDTDRVIASFADRLPMRRIFEPRRGLSQARNAAVAAVSSDYYVWTDDDVTVDAHWLRAYERAFERHPTATFFGGPIRPRFSGHPPAWLAAGFRHVIGAYAGLDLSPDEIVLDAASLEVPYGANMALRGDAQRSFRYHACLGRQPGSVMLSGEDTHALRRLAAGGAVGIWLPDAAVEHRIDVERQTVAYLRRYHHGIGATERLTALLFGQQIDWRQEMGAATRAARQAARYLAGRMMARPDIWLPALAESTRLWGWLRARRHRIEQPRAAQGSG